MAFLTNGLPSLAGYTGSERTAWDTNAAAGGQPQLVEMNLAKLGLILSQLSNGLSKTMVAGSIYYSQFNIGALLTNPPGPKTQSLQSNYSLTGVNVSVGGTGGTDLWAVALYNSAGVLVGSSNVAGVIAAAANTIQQIPFAVGTVATPLAGLDSGVYYIALQSNGTTATFKSINSPIWPLDTGSQTGAFGTFAVLAPVPDGVYTANVGPQVTLY